jgi:hypothetical protein
LRKKLCALKGRRFQQLADKKQNSPVLDDQVHPTASSGSLQHSKVNKNRFPAHPESTVLDRFGKNHRSTSGPRLFQQAFQAVPLQNCASFRKLFSPARTSMK